MSDDMTREFADNQLRKQESKEPKKKRGFFDRFRERPEVREARESSFKREEIKQAKKKGKRQAQEKYQKGGESGIFSGLGSYTSDVSKGNPFASSQMFYGTQQKPRKKKKKVKYMKVRVI